MAHCNGDIFKSERDVQILLRAKNCKEGLPTIAQVLENDEGNLI